MLQVTAIPVARCRASPTARPMKEGHLLLLMASIRQIGLRQPINVRVVEGGYEVRGGGHRLEAFRRLGLAEIPALIGEDDDYRAELAEIDENLIRNELSPAERAIAIARRKAIYEALHPETAHGGDRKSSRQVGDLIEPEREEAEPAERFTKATAKDVGLSERAVQRDAARTEKIGTEALGRLIGTNLDTGEQIDALAKLSPERRDALIEKAASGQDVNAVAAVKAEKREAKEKDLAQRTLALPQSKFNVIYADPPWRFEPFSRETGMDRAPENHYPTETTQDICDMPIGDIADENCVLFLWATVPMLPDAFKVMEAWGFAYKSHCIWNKDQAGTGYWFRNKHELLLVGVKGSIPAPLPGTQSLSVIDGPVKEHSRKPLIFRAMIEALFPNLPKIELFARTAAPGWTPYGKEAPEPIADETDMRLDGTISARQAQLLAQHNAEMEAETPPTSHYLPKHDPETGEIGETGEIEDDGLDIPSFLKREVA